MSELHVKKRIEELKQEIDALEEMVRTKMAFLESMTHFMKLNAQSSGETKDG